MTRPILVELLHNISILLAFAMLYSNFWLKSNKNTTLPGKIISGIITGLIGVLLMHTSVYFSDGISFDTRTVLLSVTGLFFGAIPTITAMIILSVSRIVTGGDGIIMGLATIISSGIFGIIWHRFRSTQITAHPLKEFFLLGLVVHLFMLLSVVFLPSDIRVFTLESLALPVIFLYIPGTFILASLMNKQKVNYENSLAKEKLMQTESLLTNILKGGNFIAIILSKNGTLQFNNEYLLKISGYSENEIRNKKWTDIFYDKKCEVNEYFDKSNLSTFREEENINYIITKNNEKYYISWHIPKNKTYNAKTESITAIGINITDRLTYEAKLEEKNRIIKQKNNEYKILNDKLNFAKEKAEESDNLKTAFLSNLSHELRTPLNGILGFMQLLQEKSLDTEEIATYTKFINESSDRMLNTINSIVHISRLQTELNKPNKKDIAIYEQMILLSEKYQSVAIDSDLDFRLRISDDLKSLILHTDSELLSSALNHLLDNAFKFTSSGFVEFGYYKNSVNVEFYVKDTGIGISEKFQDKIFDDFTQAYNFITEPVEGLGLGLSVAKKYIQFLGGDISVESEEGKGSTFKFYIPIE